MNSHEEQIEREKTGGESPLFVELIISFHDGIEDEELVFDESELENVKKTFKEAKKIAKYDNDTVLTEIRMFERWHYANDEIVEKDIDSNT